MNGPGLEHSEASLHEEDDGARVEHCGLNPRLVTEDRNNPGTCRREHATNAQNEAVSRRTRMRRCALLASACTAASAAIVECNVIILTS